MLSSGIVFWKKEGRALLKLELVLFKDPPPQPVMYFIMDAFLPPSLPSFPWFTFPSLSHDHPGNSFQSLIPVTLFLLFFISGCFKTAHLQRIHIMKFPSTVLIGTHSWHGMLYEAQEQNLMLVNHWFPFFIHDALSLVLYLNSESLVLKLCSLEVSSLKIAVCVSVSSCDGSSLPRGSCPHKIKSSSLKQKWCNLRRVWSSWSLSKLQECVSSLFLYLIIE